MNNLFLCFKFDTSGPLWPIALVSILGFTASVLFLWLVIYLLRRWGIKVGEKKERERLEKEAEKTAKKSEKTD